MTYDEALAVARLRQWASNKQTNRNGKTRNPNSLGWKNRDNRSADAVIVRILDFERALNQLDNAEQVALIMRYRDRESNEEISRLLCCSVRRVGYLIPTARQKLAVVLERWNLL
jgi:DNA-directed RNA polymerase specialized sigma24 family protein